VTSIPTNRTREVTIRGKERRALERRGLDRGSDQILPIPVNGGKEIQLVDLNGHSQIENATTTGDRATTGVSHAIET
jgi:hypothetical protein